MHRLTATEIEARIKDAGKPVNADFARIFRMTASQVEGGDVKAAWDLLWSVFIFDMRMRDEGSGPILLLPGDRKEPQQLTPEEVEFLAYILADAGDPEVRARLGDVLWLARRDHKAAAVAVDAYLESAARVLDAEHWVAGAQRLDRALALAKSLRDRDRITRAATRITDALCLLDGADPSFLSVHLHGTLIDNKVGDPAILMKLAEKSARNASKPNDWRRAGQAWRLVGAWRRRLHDANGARAAEQNAARTHIGEADDALKREPPSHAVAASFIEDAIQGLRQHGADKAELQALLARLEDHQREMMKEMTVLSLRVDAGESRKAVEAWVDRADIHEALLQLVRISRWPLQEELAKEARNQRSKSVFRQIIGEQRVGPTGKNVARPTSAIDASKEPSREEILRVQNLHHQQAAVMQIIPAARAIMRRHGLTASDLMPYLNANAFVPDGREAMWARGLVAGLRGDFSDAATLLLPQLEAALRHEVASRGVVTARLAADGVQDEMDLNAILFRPELREFLDEDLIFDLQGLLVDRHGSNLRNLLAHGLIEERQAHTAAAYTWWLILALVLWPFLPEIQAVANSGPAT